MKTAGFYTVTVNWFSSVGGYKFVKHSACNWKDALDWASQYPAGECVIYIRKWFGFGRIIARVGAL